MENATPTLPHPVLMQSSIEHHFYRGPWPELPFPSSVSSKSPGIEAYHYKKSPGRTAILPNPHVGLPPPIQLRHSPLERLYGGRARSAALPELTSFTQQAGSYDTHMRQPPLTVPNLAAQHQHPFNNCPSKMSVSALLN